MLEINLYAIKTFFEKLFLKYGISNSISHAFNLIILTSLAIAAAIIANYIFKKIIIRIIKHWVDKSTNKYDDIFYKKGVFNKMSHLAPILVLFYIVPIILEEYQTLIGFIKIVVNIYLICIILILLNSVIDALHDIYNSLPTSKNRSIKGYVHSVKGIIIFIGSLIILSILINKDLSSLFAGLTAFAAVLMFIFKDAILGLVAGIQISANDILRIGDTIEMPSRNINGTVIDISLSIVKVHNINRTISTIPVYAFVSETFWNWRGLETVDGRLMKRFININIQTIKYCDEKMIENFKKNEFLRIFFEQQSFELTGAEKAVGKGKMLTNATLFRAYIETYLKNNPCINAQALLMVRHLQPSENGLPIEIYAYTKEKDTIKYEKLQSDIFDHIISIAPEFGLRIFQKPAG